MLSIKDGVSNRGTN